ncbi:hypothetical protein NPIL_674221 [Nephila pilipes]|uniref:Integrase catalytic domain-containing protein n=1 Tax=Nephila pilipes TaxID=299642 RepID=A0A8X6QP93_NEPPI|nr:hypothetical protein NPIL_674221 [Nephila pilipes]
MEGYVSWCKKSLLCQYIRNITIHERFAHVYRDVDSLYSSQGYCYCLRDTVLDRYMRWLIIIPLVDQLDNSITQAFVIGWVTKFRVLIILTIDQGRVYESDLFKAFKEFLDYHKTCLAIYVLAWYRIMEIFRR